MARKGHCVTIIGVLILVLAIWDMVANLTWANIAFLIIGIVLIAHEASNCCSTRSTAPLSAAKPAAKPAKKPIKKVKK